MNIRVDPAARGTGRPDLFANPLVWLAVIGLVYAPMLFGAFQSDDFNLLDSIRSDGPLSVWTWRSSFLRPLASLLLFAQGALGGWKPAAFHATSLALHACGAWLLVRNAARLRERTGAGPRVVWPIGAIAFALLPSHLEPVCWISCQADLLAAVLGLASLDLLLRRPEGSGLRVHAAWITCAALAMLSKESVVALPAILLLAEAWIAPRSRASLARVALACALLLVGYALVRRACLGEWVAGYGHGSMAHPRVAVVLANLALFPLRTLFAPVALGPGWESMAGARAADFHRLFEGTSARVVLILAAAAGLAALWVWRARWIGLPASLRFAFAGFALACLPVLTLRVSLVDSQGERLLYFPGMFLCLALGELLQPLLRRRAVAVAGLAVVFVAALTLVRGQSSWTSAQHLATDLVDATARHVGAAPGDSLVVLNLPDNLRGAYVLRNGLHHGIRLRQGIDPSRVVGPLTVSSILDPGDTIHVARVGDLVRIELRGRGRRFLDANESGLALGRWAGVPTGGADSPRREIAGLESVPMLWYSDGRLRPLAP